jgi:hypothetical protein
MQRLQHGMQCTSTLLRSDSNFGLSLEGPDEGNGGHGVRAGSWPPSLQGSAATCASRSAPRRCWWSPAAWVLPANAVSAPNAKIVGNFAPPSCTSPNVCPDSAGHAPSRCISLQLLRLNPETVSIQGILYDTLPVGQVFGLMRPDVFCKISGPRRRFQLFDSNYYHEFMKNTATITTHYHTLLLMPWIAELSLRPFLSAWRRPRGSRRRCRDDSNWRQGLYIYFVDSLSCLSAAVDQDAPPHYGASWSTAAERQLRESTK